MHVNTIIQVKLASSHSRVQHAAKVMPWRRGGEGGVNWASGGAARGGVNGASGGRAAQGAQERRERRGRAQQHPPPAMPAMPHASRPLRGPPPPAPQPFAPAPHQVIQRERHLQEVGPVVHAPRHRALAKLLCHLAARARTRAAS
jgi:hypothetical protein